MNKALMASTLLMAGLAQAQTAVQLYGIADAAVQSSKGSVTTTGIESGGLNGSRWGLRGTEDLGGGLLATFRLESGFNIDTGMSAQGGRLFGRQSTVGLSGAFGAVRLGRTLSPIGAFSEESSTLGTKVADIMAVAGTVGTGALYRTDNGINYDAPNLRGLAITAQYSPQVNGNEAVDKVGRNHGIAALYKSGPVQGGMAFASLKTRPDAHDTRSLQFNGAFDFGGIVLRAVFNRDKALLAEARTVTAVEVVGTFGALTAAIGAGRVAHVAGGTRPDDSATVATLQGTYWLSKRTALYSYFTHVSNGSGSSLGYSAPALGQGSRLVQLGLRHGF